MSKKKKESGRKTFKSSRIISVEDVQKQRDKIYCIVGGENTEEEDENPPTITLKKSKDGAITKITVKCSCGKYAELDCTYK